MRLTVTQGGQSYAVVLKRGALARVGQLAALHRRVLLLTDAGVPARYVKALLRQCTQGFVLALPMGEVGKTAEAWQLVVQKLQAEGFGRQDAILALGGGLVCDVAGFAAAAYMGGIDVLLVPSTTCAQMDAALGGRACLNQGGVKDVLELAHPPRLTVADPDLLESLPPRQLASGMAAALKVALTSAPGLLGILENEDVQANTERILYLALEAKKALIEQPAPGAKARLAFGRLLGNAIEAAGGFAHFTHGEALALGLLPMLESRTLQRRVRAIMEKLGLPLRQPFGARQLMAEIEKSHAMGEDGCFGLARVKKAGEAYVERVSAEELRLLLGG